MATNAFKKLLPKIKLTDRNKPRYVEDRLHALEEDVRDLRSALRELVVILEKETGRDLDRDRVIGRIGSNRGMKKMPAFSKTLPTRRGDALPMNLP
jgi:hypothetical protein